MILIRILIRIPQILWLLLAGYLAWSDYGEFKAGERTTLEQGITEKQNLLKARLNTISRTEDFSSKKAEKIAQIQDLQQQLDSSRAQLPRSSSMPELLKSLADTADSTGMVLPKFRPGKERDKSASSFLVETPIEVTLNGTYVQIMSFLDSIANLTRVVATEKLSFDTVKNRGGVSVLTASATLVTYHLEDNNKSAAPTSANR